MVDLKVEGMNCQHCQAAVEKALKDVPGVTGVDVSLDAGRVRVEGKADVGALVEAVSAAGYTARPAEAGSP